MVNLIQNSDFINRSYLDKNIDDKTLKMAIWDCQNLIVEPIIGTTLYNKLKADAVAYVMSPAYQTFVVQYLWPVIIEGAQYLLVKNLVYRWTRSSIVKDQNSTSNSVDINELHGIMKDRENAMNHYVRILKRHLELNTASYPEYSTLSLDAILPQTGVNVPFYVNDDITNEIFNENYKL